MLEDDLNQFLYTKILKYSEMSAKTLSHCPFMFSKNRKKLLLKLARKLIGRHCLCTTHMLHKVICVGNEANGIFFP